VSELNSQLGLTGTGVKIGFYEGAEFTVGSSLDLPATRFTVLPGSSGSKDQHANHCARILAGTYGVASNASVYTHNPDHITYSNESSIEKLLDAGVSLISMSWTTGRPDPATYTDFAVWFDHVISYHHVAVFALAGNDLAWDPGCYPYVPNPASADNVIAVGAINTNYTLNTNDDTGSDFCYEESSGYYVEKPDIMAPGGDTSSATPFAAGIAALMHQLRPSLKVFPEATKAILMASCHYKTPINGNTELMTAGITERQGAGVISAYLTVAITGQGNYGAGITNANVVKDIRFRQQYYGASGLNVSLTWLKGATAVCNSTFQTNPVGQQRQNLKLTLKYGISTTPLVSKVTV